MRALLIADGKYTAGSLAATRGLGRAGWTVGIGSPVRAGYAVTSRWASHWHSVPSPTAGLGAFVSAVNAAIRDKGYEVVFGAGDAELMALSFARRDIAAAIPYAPHACVVRAVDKLDLEAAAAAVGLRTPRTLAADDDAFSSFGQRCLVKSRLHWRPENAASPIRMNVTMVSSRDEARRSIAEIRRHGGEPIMQEVVDGQLMAVTALTDKAARMVACMQQLAPRTWPPMVGEPARAHTVRVDPDLADKVAALLKELRWFGLVQLQFILGHDKLPRLIDFNGRTYASAALAEAAGINFHDLWARLATDRESVPVKEASEGRRYHWMEGDLKRALTQRRGGLVRDLASCFAYAPGAVHAIWRWRDPRPILEVAKHLAEDWTKVQS